LVFEATEKRQLLKKAYENSPIESTSGVINRALFWWLRDLLWRGSKTTLTVDSLPSLDDDLKNASTSQSLFDKWDNGELRDSKGIPPPKKKKRIIDLIFQLTNIGQMRFCGPFCITTNGRFWKAFFPDSPIQDFASRNLFSWSAFLIS
jgi:hypothetical protein